MAWRAFGTFDVVAHPRIGVLLSGLGDHGIEIELCVEPLDIPTRERVRALFEPRHALSFFWKVGRRWWRLVRRTRRLGDTDVVVVGYLGHFDVHLARLLHRRSTIVLDHLISAADTARDRGMASGLMTRALAALDRSALRRADIVVVDTEEHSELVPADLDVLTVVAPVGAPPTWFDSAPTQWDGGPLRVVFFGLYTPLQGTPVIARAVVDRPDLDISLTMIGDGQDRPQVEAILDGDSRVTFIDWVDAHRLPQVVAEHHVCLGIFDDGPKARRVVPNKVFQGAAAGCAIVTSDTPPQRRQLGDAARYVTPGDATALGAALEQLSEDRASVEALAVASRRLAEAEFRPAAVAQPVIDAVAAAGRAA